MKELTKEQEALLNESIHILSIPSRTINALEKEGIITVCHLLHCNKKDILSIKNLGQKSLNQILESLEKIGFSAG